jgi:hypothetical protein
MSKKRNFLQPKCTLAKLGVYLMLMMLLQDNSKMLFMFLLILGVDQDVINEYHGKIVELWHEH